MQLADECRPCIAVLSTHTGCYIYWIGVCSRALTVVTHSTKYLRVVRKDCDRLGNRLF